MLERVDPTMATPGSCDPKDVRCQDAAAIHQQVVLAPMVRGSELAFRQIVRRYGVATCYSPMLRAEEVEKAFRIWKEKDNCRWPLPDSMIPKEIVHEDGILFFKDILPDPAPVVAQLCGNDPNILRKAAKALLHLHYDKTFPCSLEGIDFNLGCPQSCARTGNFGAFLAENDAGRALECIRAMRETMDDAYGTENQSCNDTISRPKLSCKIRLLDNDAESIRFAQDLIEAGCELLAVHCRKRVVKSEGPPDLRAGQAVVESLSGVPVLINGGIMTKQDINDTLQATKACGVMLATGFLRNPHLLVQPTVDPATLAAEYLESCERYPPVSHMYLQKHLRWIFRSYLEPKDKSPGSFQDWRPRLWTFLVRPYLTTIDQFKQVVALYVKMNGSELPEYLKDQPEPSFKSIKQQTRGESSQSQTEEVLAVLNKRRKAQGDEICFGTTTSSQ